MRDQRERKRSTSIPVLPTAPPSSAATTAMTRLSACCISSHNTRRRARSVVQQAPPQGRPQGIAHWHQLKWPAPDPQVDRKGQPYSTTDQPSKLVETKCWVCPSPGVVRATFAQP